MIDTATDNIRTIDWRRIDAFRDAAELHDGMAPLAGYIAAAIIDGWDDLGIHLDHALDAGDAFISEGEELASCFMEEFASCGRFGNWQLAAYRAWRRMVWTGAPNSTRVDGVAVTDSDLLTLGRRIAHIADDSSMIDIDYAAWRTGWGAMQPIADAVAALHATGDTSGFEDCLDILSSAVYSGAVKAPRLREKQYGSLSIAGRLGAITAS